jgi:hypothetical protein
MGGRSGNFRYNQGMDYEAPGLEKDAFNCLHCGAYAKQFRRAAMVLTVNYTHISHEGTIFHVTTCTRCDGKQVWFGDKMIFPATSTAPRPNQDMPEDIRLDYEEARAIVSQSPRAAAALLRLSIQKLCAYLGESGENINNDIGELVKKGLSVRVQRAWDIVRVIGNESVHPGQIDLNDNPEIAHALFGLVNLIVDQQISEEKRVDELYAKLPKDKLNGIANRDKEK